MLTRKDFKQIAKIFKGVCLNHLNIREQVIIKLLVELFANWLQTTNPRFDRERFIDACNEHFDAGNV